MDDIEKNRREWFQDYVARVERGVIKAPGSGIIYICPCCQYPTLQERGGYEICALCNWEDDGQDDLHADEVWGGPNGRYSLAEARENFKKNLVMYGSIDPRIGGADSTLEKQAKVSIIDAFEKMRGEADTEMLNKLWAEVNQGRQLLSQELQRKIREYEEQHRK